MKKFSEFKPVRKVNEAEANLPNFEKYDRSGNKKHNNPRKKR